MSFLCELCVLARKFASLFDHLTQVQLAVICDYFISWNFSFANLPWCKIYCYQFELIKQLSVSTFKIWILWNKNKIIELSQLHTCGWGIIKTVLAVDWISSCVTAIFLGWPIWGPSKCNQGRTGNYKHYIIKCCCTVSNPLFIKWKQKKSFSQWHQDLRLTCRACFVTKPLVLS